MNRLAFVISLTLHIVVIFISHFGFDSFFSEKIKDSGYAVFDFVEIGPKSKAPIISDTEGKVSKTKAKTKEDENVNIKNQPSESSAKENLEKENKKENALEKKSDNQKEEKSVYLKDKKKDKPKKSPEKKKTVNNNSKASEKAVVNLRKNKKNANTNPKIATKSFNSLLDSALSDSNNENSGVKAEEIGEVLTTTQIDLIRQTIRKCWHFPAGLKNAEDLIVDIRMELDETGTVKKAEILNKNRMDSDSDFRIAAENAYRAVLDPNCNPLPLPKEKYAEWKELELSFNPKEMFE
ncbi:MAG: cell envelope integrity protein TolA [Holosporales bacterium]|jgi:hypothetical protein|nr:cell envelope integrity protein TolA [Holosporales bacterium]